MENKIIQQINTLFAGADERNWDKVMLVMDKQVLLDYSSMTGISATNLSPEQITTAWAAFLPGFDRTNHQLSDFEVKIDGDEALVHYVGNADHYLDSEIWTVKGSYNTKLKRIKGDWLITTHTFNFEKQAGNTKLPEEVTKKMQRLSSKEKS